MTEYRILKRWEHDFDAHDTFMADHVPARLTPEERERLNAIKDAEVAAWIKRKKGA